MWFLYLVLLCQSLLCQDSTVAISGVINDDNGRPLPFASIRIVGTQIGTVSNPEGEYQISLSYGIYRLKFSYVGYETQTRTVDLKQAERLDVVLTQNAVQLAEVIVDGEDPAYPIIRETIKRKRKMQVQTASYNAKMYTKESYGNDTLLFLISEAYSTIYKAENEVQKEVVVHRRQSSNIPDQLQVALVGSFLNLYGDRVTDRGYTFVSPIADDAFDHYQYRLINSSTVGQRTLHEIEVIPESRTTPLFAGTIIVDDSAYLMMKADLAPNDIFHIQHYRIKKYLISQQYSLYEDRYWMPLDYHISGALTFNFFGIKNDSIIIKYRKSVVCYEYQFDRRRDDSIAMLPDLTVLSSKDTSGHDPWKKVQLFPLNSMEKRSYLMIDSIVRVNGNMVAEFLSTFFYYDSLLQKFDLRYNRVEGLYLGGKFRTNLFPWLRAGGAAGVALEEKEVKYRANIETGLGFSPYFWLGGEVYQTIGTGPLNYDANHTSNAFSTFINAEDYFDYYRRQGRRLYLRFEKGNTVDITTGAMDEHQYTLSKNTDVSLRSIGGAFELRKNPGIDEGRMVSIFSEFSAQTATPIFALRPPEISIKARIEYSQRSFGADFDFTSMYGSAAFRLYPMGQSRLFDPYIALTIAGGRSIGTPPIQRIFGLVAPLSGFSFATSLRTVGIGEFTGDRFIFASIDYNIRNILFIKLGYPHFVYDILLGMSYGSIGNQTPALAGRVNPLPGGYREYRVGIGRIFEVFQFTFTYSDHLTGRYSFTTSMTL